MIKFWSTREAASALSISADRVLQLVRAQRLATRKLGGTHGDYRFHPVDVERLGAVRDLAKGPQDSLKPDIVWVERACRYLAECVQQSDFDPQQVVGIAFGGILPAAFVSVFLQRPLQVLRISHYDGQVRLPAPVVVEGQGSIPGIDTLVVDDVADSGETLEEAQSYLYSYGVSEARFATLHRKPSSSFVPDWYVDVVDGWVHYPWEGL